MRRIREAHLDPVQALLLLQHLDPHADVVSVVGDTPALLGLTLASEPAEGSVIRDQNLFRGHHHPHHLPPAAAAAEPAAPGSNCRESLRLKFPAAGDPTCVA